MCKDKIIRKEKSGAYIDIAEYCPNKFNFNIQNIKSKPLDLSLMTGKNLKKTKGGEKK